MLLEKSEAKNFETFWTGKSPVSDILLKMLGLSLSQLGPWRDLYLRNDGGELRCVLLGRYGAQGADTFVAQFHTHPRFLRVVKEDVESFQRIEFHMRDVDASSDEYRNAVMTWVKERSSDQTRMQRVFRNYSAAEGQRIRDGLEFPKRISVD